LPESGSRPLERGIDLSKSSKLSLSVYAMAISIGPPATLIESASSIARDLLPIFRKNLRVFL